MRYNRQSTRYRILSTMTSLLASLLAGVCLTAEQPKPDFPMDSMFKENLALASLGATATSDSELDREKGCTPKVIDGIVDTDNRWHSSIATPHPHWVQIKLPKPARIGWVVLHFADPVGPAVEFRGLVLPEGQKQWRETFRISRHRDPLGCAARSSLC